MNDSFLEDMGLEPVEREKTSRNAYRHITSRSTEASPKQACPEEKALSILIAEQRAKDKIAATSSTIKVTRRRSDETKTIVHRGDTKNPVDKNSPRTQRVTANAGKLEVSKPPIGSKERPFWQGSSKETSRLSDASSKDNSRPSDSSRDSVSQLDTNNPKVCNRGGGDGQSRKNKATENFQIALLNSVKEIVSTYTKNETEKILMAMHDFYIKSQGNFVKLTLEQTEEIVNETRVANERIDNESSPSRLKYALAQAMSLNQELRQENERIKQENVRLKLRCEELVKSGDTKSRTK